MIINYENLPDKNKTLTICASTRLEREIKYVFYDLTSKGYTIIPIICDKRRNFTHEELKNLAISNMNKIKITDGIIVISMDKIIGETVSQEILFAKSINKHISYAYLTSDNNDNSMILLEPYRTLISNCHKISQNPNQVMDILTNIDIPSTIRIKISELHAKTIIKNIFNLAHYSEILCYYKNEKDYKPLIQKHSDMFRFANSLIKLEERKIKNDKKIELEFKLKQVIEEYMKDSLYSGIPIPKDIYPKIYRNMNILYYRNKLEPYLLQKSPAFSINSNREKLLDKLKDSIYNCTSASSNIIKWFIDYYMPIIITDGFSAFDKEIETIENYLKQ